jgi:hypothetical protein
MGAWSVPDIPGDLRIWKSPIFVHRFLTLPSRSLLCHAFKLSPIILSIMFQGSFVLECTLPDLKPCPSLELGASTFLLPLWRIVDIVLRDDSTQTPVADAGDYSWPDLRCLAPSSQLSTEFNNIIKMFRSKSPYPLSPQSSNPPSYIPLSTLPFFNRGLDLPCPCSPPIYSC